MAALEKPGGTSYAGAREKPDAGAGVVLPLVKLLPWHLKLDGGAGVGGGAGMGGADGST